MAEQIDLTAAIKAIDDWLCQEGWGQGDNIQVPELLAVAAPLIEQAVREQVAQAIQRRHDELDEGDVWQNEGRAYLAEAVEIARGGESRGA